MSVGSREPSQSAAQALGLLLWGANSSPINGVGIAPRDLARFPTYTGGLPVQDINGDHRLDPAVDKVVGGIIGAAPSGATGQAATSPLGADGRPVLSGETARNAAYPPAAGGGEPHPGLLTIQFKAGSLPGASRPTVELIGGNSDQFTIEAVARRRRHSSDSTPAAIRICRDAGPRLRKAPAGSSLALVMEIPDSGRQRRSRTFRLSVSNPSSMKS